MPQISQVKNNFKKQEEDYQKKFIVYHTNWSTYSDYQVSNIPIDYIPEISYAFFNLKENGEIYSGDSWADLEKGDGGNLQEFFKLKKSGKNFNLTLSIGGWSWSKYFSSAVSTENNRQNFVTSIINLFLKYPIFSGVSLDWEYCTNDSNNYGNAGNLTNKDDSKNLREFCKLLKSTLQKNKMENYKISTCTSADVNTVKLLEIKQLESYIDEFHIMTYDFMGFSGSQNKTGHHTNLKRCDYCLYSVEGIVEYFLQTGIKSTKIFIGAAAYSRGFKQTNGPGSTGIGSGETFKYKELPQTGFIEYWDPKCLAPFLYNSDTKDYISYDNKNSIYEKSKYVWEKNLGGIIIWESSGDRPVTDEKSLIKSLNEYLLKDPRKITPPQLPLIWPVKKVTFDPQPAPIQPSPPQTTLPPVPPAQPLPSTPPVQPLPPTPPKEQIKEGMWVIDKIYNLGDIVTFKNKIYRCTAPHKSVLTWDPENPKSSWKEVVECTCKKIKTIKIKGEFDMKNIEIIYEE